MDMATTMSPHKAAPAPSSRSLPRHLCPNSMRLDVSNIRRRAKTIRRLVRLEGNPPTDIHDNSSHLDSLLSLWSSVTTLLHLRTVLSSPPRDLDTLGLLTREDLYPKRDTIPQHVLQACVKGLKKAIRHLIRHALNLSRLKYGKALLRMFVKKPNVALKSILRTDAGNTTFTTLLTDLSVIKDDISRFLITTPAKVVRKIAEQETIALSLDHTLPLGAPFP